MFVLLLVCWMIVIKKIVLFLWIYFLMWKWREVNNMIFFSKTILDFVIDKKNFKLDIEFYIDKRILIKKL